MTSGRGQSGEPLAIREVAHQGRRLLAWCVHAYTALGLVSAAGMAVLIVRGDDAALQRRPSR